MNRVKASKPHSNQNATTPNQATYRDCSLGQLCLMMKGKQINSGNGAEPPVAGERLLKTGDYLFRKGDPFLSFYVVKKGVVKTIARNGKVELDVIGFYLPGELLGAEAISIGRHLYSAKAAVDTSICDIPFDQLSAWIKSSYGGREEIMRVMSNELTETAKQNEACRKRSTPARLAAFFTIMSKRMGENGMATKTLALEMTRVDIAAYLRTTPETISRLFRRFQEEGLVVVDEKRVQLVDVGGLHAMAQLDGRA